MTYKETLFFVAKCLTISLEEQNKKEIENQLKTTEIDWDAVVKVSTAHLVFSTLYCNLKRANFTHLLPEELVSYMIHITDLNRERNQQIIEQAKEINNLLLANNITPIFLKGTGNLLEGLYEDIAERMVGDIDFVFSKDDYPKAIKVLSNFKYSRVHKDNYDPISFKHYPRLQKENNIAAIEIHKELLIEKYANEFNYLIIKEDSQIINSTHVMSFDNQLALSIIAKQINDDGFYFKNIALRNAYDVFLLSKKTEAKTAFNKFVHLKKPLNCFLATCYEVFNKPESLQYKNSKEIEVYLKSFKTLLADEKLRNKRYTKIKNTLSIKERYTIIYKSIFDKTYRNWLLKRTTDKNWRQEKLNQLGIKKSKPNS
jgi:ribosomal protein L10